MRRASFVAGIVVLGAGWSIAAAGYGVTGHMLAHMSAVAIAAPLVACGVAGTRLDPAMRWPAVIAPLPMSVIELFVVWGWHVPAARALADGHFGGLALEQATFAVAGLLLWSACLGTAAAASGARRASGVIALLLTTMHMTLLGALVALAPRTLYGSAGFTCLGVAVPPLADQQLGAVVMLLVGAGSYLVGGVALVSSLLREQRPQMARP